MRNVANLVPPYSPTGLTHGVSAALEFAVQGLKVRHIIVMGHSRCGGVRAFAENRGRPHVSDFIDSWVQLIAPAAASLGPDATLAGDLTPLEQASIVMTLGNLMTFPWIRSCVEAQELNLLGAYFDVATGRLSAYDRTNGTFAPVHPSEAEAIPQDPLLRTADRELDDAHQDEACRHDEIAP
jgi:carbonic anhydrase